MTLTPKQNLLRNLPMTDRPHLWMSGGYWRINKHPQYSKITRDGLKAIEWAIEKNREIMRRKLNESIESEQG